MVAAAGQGRGAVTQWLVQGTIWLVVGYLVLSPITMLVYGAFRTAPPTAAGHFTLENFGVIFSANYLEAFWNTIVFGFGTAAGCTVLGTFTRLAGLPHRHAGPQGCWRS